jgi:hypothetical protein
MSDQYALFGDDDPSHGETLKNEGMEKALNKESVSDWQDAVKLWAWRMNAGHLFTSEDVTEKFGLPTGEVKTNKNNAVGAIMNAIAKKGVIRNTGNYVKSSRPSSHSAVIAVWERTQLGKEPNVRKPDPVPVPSDAAADRAQWQRDKHTEWPEQHADDCANLTGGFQCDCGAA